MVHEFEQQKMQGKMQCTMVKKNPERDYFIGNGNERVQLGKTDAEKDLGVIIENNGKSSKQIQSAVSRANSI